MTASDFDGYTGWALYVTRRAAGYFGELRYMSDGREILKILLSPHFTALLLALKIARLLDDRNALRSMVGARSTAELWRSVNGLLGGTGRISAGKIGELKRALCRKIDTLARGLGLEVKLRSLIDSLGWGMGYALPPEDIRLVTFNFDIDDLIERRPDQNEESGPPFG
jgi:hypothetical protein